MADEQTTDLVILSRPGDAIEANFEEVKAYIEQTLEQRAEAARLVEEQKQAYLAEQEAIALDAVARSKAIQEEATAAPPVAADVPAPINDDRYEFTFSLTCTRRELDALIEAAKALGLTGTVACRATPQT